MSTSLIISIAFSLSVILLYRPLGKIIRSILKRRRKKNSILSCDGKEFKNRVLGLYKSALRDYDVLIKEVKEMEETLKGVQCDTIADNKEKLGKELDSCIAVNIKQATDQLMKAKEELAANMANVAADNIRAIINKSKDDKLNSEIISTLSRDLSKKLH